MKAFVFNAKNFLDGLSERNISAHAAASAFYMFVSLVPFVALISAVIPYTGTTQQSLISYIGTYIPDALQRLIGDIVADIYIAPNAVLPISVALTVYLASRAFAALIRGIEVVSSCKRYAPFLRRTFLACVCTLGLIAAMLLVITVTFFGDLLLGKVFAPFAIVLLRLRFLFVGIALFAIFMLLYRLTPCIKPTFHSLFAGAVFAACAWLLFTWLFSLFLMYGNSYDTYGSLAAIVISLLWMYWCMYIILLGAYINSFFAAN